VSHSQRDLNKVRRIRDELERLGHRPLLFYLKCLDQSDARLPQLIREEIEARAWFVLCDSEYAQSSKWVQQEREIVEAMEGRSAFAVTIDLRQEIEPQFDKLRALSKRASVFLSYARQDRVLAQQFREEFLKSDFRVLDIVEDTAANVSGQMKQNIAEAVNHGFVLLLVSRDYLTSKWCQAEREYAFRVLGSRRLSNIIPFAIHGDIVTPDLPEELKKIQ